MLHRRRQLKRFAHSLVQLVLCSQWLMCLLDHQQLSPLNVSLMSHAQAHESHVTASEHSQAALWAQRHPSRLPR